MRLPSQGYRWSRSTVRRVYSPILSVVWTLLPWSKLKMSAACRPRGKNSNSNHEHLFIACLVRTGQFRAWRELCSQPYFSKMHAMDCQSFFTPLPPSPMPRRRPLVHGVSLIPSYFHPVPAGCCVGGEFPKRRIYHPSSSPQSPTPPLILYVGLHVG